jgi:hypothetical protein
MTLGPRARLKDHGKTKASKDDPTGTRNRTDQRRDYEKDRTERKYRPLDEGIVE